YLLPEAVLATVGGQLVDELVRAGVLPDDRIHHRLAGVAVPDHRGLALVGDTERGDVVLARAGLLDGLVDHLLAAGPDLLRIVLAPARLGIDLLMLLLGAGLHPPLMVEDHRPRTGRPLIQCD